MNKVLRMKKKAVLLTIALAVLCLCASAAGEEYTLPCTYGGAEITADSETLVFTSAPGPETLAQLLPGTKVTDITLDYAAEPAEIAALQKACPGIAFHWSLDLFGRTLTPETEELILNDTPLGSTDVFYEVLPLLPVLKKTEMCGCGIGNEEMDALRSAFPEKGIVWSIKTQHWTVRTDTTYFATWRIMKYNDEGMITEAYGINENTNATLDWLGYCRDMVALDIGHNRVESIEFVRNMPHLKYFIIADNKVKDITPLEDCKELFYLEIFQNPIEDLSPLSGLPELRHLNMCNVRATDLAPLDKLELERLYISENYLKTRGARQAKEHYLSLHPECNFTIVAKGDFTGSGWRTTETYREMRHALNRAA